VSRILIEHHYGYRKLLDRSITRSKSQDRDVRLREELSYLMCKLCNDGNKEIAYGVYFNGEDIACLTREADEGKRVKG
jgi:hypothetical protein